MFRKLQQDKRYDIIRTVHDSQGRIRVLLARTM
jgi:hypothetical protein